jgi:hypothetical protein
LLFYCSYFHGENMDHSIRRRTPADDILTGEMPGVMASANQAARQLQPLEQVNEKDLQTMLVRRVLVLSQNQVRGLCPQPEHHESGQDSCQQA